MSIEKLKAELQKMQSFDEKGGWARDFHGEKHVVPYTEYQTLHAKSARMAEMLLEAVECLEHYANYVAIDYDEKGEAVCRPNLAYELLSKLAKGAE